VKIRVAGVTIEKGKILTMRYNYGGQNVYVLPGGNLEFGEEMKDALQRELLEELQIETEVGDEVLIAEVVLNEEKTLHQLFTCKIKKGDPQLNTIETKALEVCWLDMGKIGNYNLYPNVSQYLLKDFLEDKYVGVIEQKWH
jgi:ADP-ribose pyrophosphatase YjhB (NUDIX family)